LAVGGSKGGSCGRRACSAAAVSAVGGEIMAQSTVPLRHDLRRTRLTSYCRLLWQMVLRKTARSRQRPQPQTQMTKPLPAEHCEPRQLPLLSAHAKSLPGSKADTLNIALSRLARHSPCQPPFPTVQTNPRPLPLHSPSRSNLSVRTVGREPVLGGRKVSHCIVSEARASKSPFKNIRAALRTFDVGNTNKYSRPQRHAAAKEPLEYGKTVARHKRPVYPP
jgi:hypothetical protein